MKRNWLLLVFSTGCISCVIQSYASAHFPWLTRDADNKVQLFFGEGLDDRTYKLPPAVAKAEIHQVDEKGQPARLPTTAVEQDNFVGLVTTEAVPNERVVTSSITYGIFRGSKLQYTALAYGKLPTDAQSILLPSELALQAKVIDTQSGISVQVTWEGKPLPQAKVSLCHTDQSDGEDSEVETDSTGVVTFSDKQIRDGLNAIRVGHKLDKQGQLGDTAYSGEMHYLTATFTDPESKSDTRFGALPVAITSFGAATDGKALYVYGGHMGDAHSYAFDEQSDKLLRLDLSGDRREWQEIASGTRLQGTAMVAYRDQLIIVGGFQARNKAGESKDLHSMADVRAYDTKLKTWSDLPALPEPRSSHDAAMVGSTLYVVGGWKMPGDSETQWHTTAWKMDLSKAERQWEPMAPPPFERRALAAIAHQDQLVVIGGMNRQGGPTKAVSVFDPETNRWSSLPEIHGEKPMAGFGLSGWSVNGRLVVTTQEGKIEELIGDQWKVIGETQDARFFHRVLPIGDGNLVAIGGANMGIGKFTETEVISIPRESN